MKKILISIVGLSLMLGFLPACGGGSEKDMFVSASVELGCAMFQDPKFFEDYSLVEGKTEEVFAKYGFDTKDQAAMEALGAKYQEDEEVIKAVQEGITECAGDVFGDMMLDESATTPATTPAE